MIQNNGDAYDQAKRKVIRKILWICAILCILAIVASNIWK